MRKVWLNSSLYRSPLVWVFGRWGRASFSSPEEFRNLVGRMGIMMTSMMLTHGWNSVDCKWIDGLVCFRRAVKFANRLDSFCIQDNTVPINQIKLMPTQLSNAVYITHIRVGKSRSSKFSFINITKLGCVGRLGTLSVSTTLDFLSTLPWKQSFSTCPLREQGTPVIPQSPRKSENAGGRASEQIAQCHAAEG